MKRYIYELNMSIEAIPVNYLPNLLKNNKNWNKFIYQHSKTGNMVFSTLIEDLEPLYFEKLCTFTDTPVGERFTDGKLEEIFNNFEIPIEYEFNKK